MGMQLKAPSRKDVEQVRRWRNEALNTLRTPFRLTEEMQARFYEDAICNRQSNSRWWSFYEAGALVAFGGLTDIEWENGLAEISLIVRPDVQRSGYGRKAVSMIMAEGFGNMGLNTICGECYECNPAIEFWRKITEEGGGYCTMIPRRKLWQGQLYDALHFSIWR